MSQQGLKGKIPTGRNFNEGRQEGDIPWRKDREDGPFKDVKVSSVPSRVVTDEPGRDPYVNRNRTGKMSTPSVDSGSLHCLPSRIEKGNT